MLQCLSRKSSSSSTSPAAGAAAPAPTMHSHPAPPSPTPPPSPSQGGTSSEASPSATINYEYRRAVQSNSYSEIWSRVHEVDHSHRRDDEEEEDVDEEESHHRRQRMEQVLQPNRERVEEALRHAKPNSLTRLVSDYFEQSENTTHVCLLLLHRSVRRARELYAPLYQLLDVVVVVADQPIQQSVESLSLTQPQCIRALQVFLQFDCQDNPFPSPGGSDSQNLDEMLRSFSELKDQFEHRLRSSRSRIRLIRRATLTSSLCLIGTAVGVVVSAVAITVHALTAAVVLVAAPPLCCSESGDGNGNGNGRGSCCMMTATEKREVANMKQLDDAAMGTCVLNNVLATIDRLVRRLHVAVEGDKRLILLVLERCCGPSGIGIGIGSGSGSCDKYPIQEVVKQLNKGRPNFIQLLDELEECIYLCFSTVNRARSLLLQHISTLI